MCASGLRSDLSTLIKSDGCGDQVNVSAVNARFCHARNVAEISESVRSRDSNRVRCPNGEITGGTHPNSVRLYERAVLHLHVTRTDVDISATAETKAFGINYAEVA